MHRLAVVPRAVLSVVRPTMTVSSLRSLSVFRDPATVVHRSNAEEMVSAVPVIEVDRSFAVCDGGGGGMGHPAEYITLAGRGGAGYVGTCKYCGLQFKQKDHHSHINWDKSVTTDLPAGRGPTAEQTSPSTLSSAPRTDAAPAHTAAPSATTEAASTAAATAPAPTGTQAAHPDDAAAAPAPTAGADAHSDDSGSSSSSLSSSSDSDTDGGVATRGVSDGTPAALELDLIEDTVTLTNTTDSPLKLKGWKLLSETGSQKFNFPARTVLQPGESTKVWSGRKVSKGTHHNPPHDLFWTRRYMWNNKGDTAVIVDPQGNEMNRIRLP